MINAYGWLRDNQARGIEACDASIILDLPVHALSLADDLIEYTANPERRNSEKLKRVRVPKRINAYFDNG